MRVRVSGRGAPGSCGAGGGAGGQSQSGEVSNSRLKVVLARVNSAENEC